MRATLRRPDWLAELQGLLSITIVLTGLGAVAATVTTLAGRPLDAEISSAGALGTDALPGLPAGVTVDTGLPVLVEDPTGAQRGWEVLATLPSLLLLLATLLLLRRLVGRARRDDPFTAHVLGRLRALGVLLVVGGPVAWALESVGRFALSATLMPDATYAPLDFAVPGAWALCGFGVLAVGEIVRRGRAMRVELDGVV